MAEAISPGAYVIRALGTSKVLHVPNHNSATRATTSDRHEERYRENQIWWIEADPGFQDLNKAAEEGCIYRIANIAHNVSLIVECGQGDDGTPVIIYQSQGAPWHLWNFRRLPTHTDGEYYNIFSASSGLTLDACNTGCYTRRIDSECKMQMWELLKPVISIPAGWLQLHNVATGHLLSQTYPSLPLLAIPATASSTGRESWATQWTFVHASAVDGINAESRLYVIKNRLTGTYLKRQSSKLLHRGEAAGSINAWANYCHGTESELWNLELDTELNWKIVHKSGFLLEEAVVPLLDGYEIVCDQRAHDKRKSWVLVPPVNTNGRFAGPSSPPPVRNAAAG